MRAIDADAMLVRLEEWNTSDSTDKALYNFTLNRIQEQPTIEPEQKTGKWIHIRTEEDGNALYECSVCHKGEIHVPIVKVSYCWNCGTKMEEERENRE